MSLLVRPIKSCSCVSRGPITFSCVFNLQVSIHVASDYTHWIILSRLIRKTSSFAFTLLHSSISTYNLSFLLIFISNGVFMRCVLSEHSTIIRMYERQIGIPP